MNGLCCVIGNGSREERRGKNYSGVKMMQVWSGKRIG